MMQKPSKFSSFVQGTTEPLPRPLPICHATQAFLGTKILEAGFIAPKECVNFNESLIYCFYGKSSYRSKLQEPTLLSAYLPMLFIVEHDWKVQTPRRMFPFDTGAMKGGRFDPYMHPLMTVDEFALGDDVDAARKFVKCFFGDNKRYLRNKPIENLSFPATNFYIEGFYRLILNFASNRVDGRRATLELQLAQPLPLRETKFFAVVVPELFLDDREFVQSVEDNCGVSPTSYVPPDGSSDLWYGAMESVATTLIMQRESTG